MGALGQVVSHLSASLTGSGSLLPSAGLLDGKMNPQVLAQLILMQEAEMGPWGVHYGRVLEGSSWTRGSGTE